MVSITLGLSCFARFCWGFDLGFVLGLFRSARLSRRYCFGRLSGFAFSTTLGLFRSAGARYHFDLGFFLGLFRSARFSSRHCGLPFAQDVGLRWLLHMLTRQRPHVTTRLSARLPRRSGCATIFRLLMSQLQAIRLLARSYAGAPSCPCVLRGLFLLAWAFRLSLGPGRRRGSARFPLRGAVCILLRQRWAVGSNPRSHWRSQLAELLLDVLLNLIALRFGVFTASLLAGRSSSNVLLD